MRATGRATNPLDSGKCKKKRQGLTKGNKSDKRGVFSYEATSVSSPTSSFTPQDAWGITNFQDLSNVFSEGECFGSGAVTPKSTFALTNSAWDSNADNQAWNISLNADGLLSMSNTTYGVGTSSTITPGSESGPPECGTKLPLENSFLSITHSLPNLCSSNGNISQVLTTNDETTTTRNINSSANTDFVFESRGVPIRPDQTPISSQK